MRAPHLDQDGIPPLHVDSSLQKISPGEVEDPLEYLSALHTRINLNREGLSVKIEN